MQLHLDQLHVRIAGLEICQGLDLPLDGGQNWALLGANGSGKTTLLHTLAGLRPPQGGTVRLNGHALHALPSRERARHLGVLFQDAEDVFPASVLETVLTGRHPHIPPWRWERPDDHQHARQALESVGLQSFAARDVRTLSGGERRRVGIATLLAQDTPCCLLDEPTNHLDLRHQITVLRRFAERAARPSHLNLFVLHDVNLALRFCSHGLLLFGDGECAAGPLDELINRATLRRLYGWPVRRLAGNGHAVYIPA